MSNYKEFYNFLINNNMITPIWSYILEIIDNEISKEKNKDDYLMIFSIYFSLIGEGNICISLDEDKLKAKWNKKVQATKILLKDNRN